MAVFTSTIKLVDQVSPAAKAAAGEAKTLGSAMDAVNKSLVKASALGDVKAFQSLTKQSQALTAALSQVDKGLLQEMATAKEADAKNAATALAAKQASDAKKKADIAATASAAKMANTIGAVKDAVTTSMAGIRSAFTSLAAGDVQGAIAGVTDSIAGMAKLLDLVVPGLGQAAAAVIQLAGGLVGITAGLIKSGVEFAIASSQAKEQMVSMFDALGEGKLSGEQADDMLDGLSTRLGITKDAMIPLVKQFEAMGVTSKAALEQMTTAALSAKALVGGADSGAEAFTKLAKKIELASATGQGLKIPIKGLGSLADMGLTVDDVAKKMGVSAKVLGEQLKAGTANAGKFGDALQKALIDKGAGPLEKMSLGAKNLSDLFHQYIGDLFEDMGKDVEPFLAAVKDLFGVFDSKSKPSGEAMKAGIGAFFKQVFAVLTKAVPLAKHFLLDMVIYGLKAYLAVKPIVGAIREFASSAEGAAMIGTVLKSLWTVLQAVGVVLAVVVGAVLLLWGAMIAVSVAVWTAVGAFLGFVSEAGGALGGWIASAASAAYDFIAGLVGGIGNGAGQVVDAVKGLAGSATGAFKSALGIASPSKVGRALGGNFGGSIASGVDDSAGDVHGASSGLAAAAVKGATSDGGASSSGGAAAPKGPAQVTVYIQIDGAGKSAMDITEEMVAAAMERLALGMGV